MVKKATRIAREVGADFVDIKHCHGYLLHELLGAHTRDGRYGGNFENRTRMLREIVTAIRADGNDIDITSEGLTVDGVSYTFPVGSATAFVGDNTDGSMLFTTACVYGGPFLILFSRPHLLLCRYLQLCGEDQCAYLL